MKKELPHFKIGSAYGGTQEWCPTYWMNIGGCAAITACDCSIYFELYKNLHGLYPYDINAITQADYVDFAYVMEPSVWTYISTASPNFSPITTH